MKTSLIILLAAFSMGLLQSAQARSLSAKACQLLDRSIKSISVSVQAFEEAQEINIPSYTQKVSRWYNSEILLRLNEMSGVLFKTIKYVPVSNYYFGHCADLSAFVLYQSSLRSQGLCIRKSDTLSIILDEHINKYENLLKRNFNGSESQQTMELLLSYQSDLARLKAYCK